MLSGYILTAYNYLCALFGRFKIQCLLCFIHSKPIRAESDGIENLTAWHDTQSTRAYIETRFACTRFDYLVCISINHSSAGRCFVGNVTWSISIACLHVESKP